MGFGGGLLRGTTSLAYTTYVAGWLLQGEILLQFTLAWESERVIGYAMLQCMHVSMYVCMYACMHACMYVCVCMILVHSGCNHSHAIHLGEAFFPNSTISLYKLFPNERTQMSKQQQTSTNYCCFIYFLCPAFFKASTCTNILLYQALLYFSMGLKGSM